MTTDEEAAVGQGDDLSRPLPGTRPELELEYASLRDDVMAIEQQLADRNRLGEDGTRQRGHEFWDWRRRAITAKSIKQRRMLAVKFALRGVAVGSNASPAAQEAWLSYSKQRYYVLHELCLELLRHHSSSDELRTLVSKALSDVDDIPRPDDGGAP